MFLVSETRGNYRTNQHFVRPGKKCKKQVNVSTSTRYGRHDHVLRNDLHLDLFPKKAQKKNICASNLCQIMRKPLAIAHHNIQQSHRSFYHYHDHYLQRGCHQCATMIGASSSKRKNLC